MCVFSFLGLTSIVHMGWAAAASGKDTGIVLAIVYPWWEQIKCASLWSWAPSIFPRWYLLNSYLHNFHEVHAVHCCILQPWNHQSTYCLQICSHSFSPWSLSFTLLPYSLYNMSGARIQDWIQSRTTPSPFSWALGYWFCWLVGVYLTLQRVMWEDWLKSFKHVHDFWSRNYPSGESKEISGT